jgi:uncharacterized RDD family membrane protein YckC
MCPVLDEVDPRTLRTAWRRLVAISIDLLVVAGMELLLLTALRIPWSHVGEALFDRRVGVLDAVVGFAYPIVLRRYGPDDGAATWFPWQLGLVAAWVTVDLIAMLSSARRRALHDVIARTVVVRVGKGRQVAGLQLATI